MYYYYSAGGTASLSVLSEHMSMMIIVENYKGYSHTLPTMHIRQGDSSIIAWIAQPCRLSTVPAIEG